MAQAAQTIAAPMRPQTKESALRGVEKPPVRIGWLKSFLRFLTKGELIFVADGEEKQYAQRWPAPAVAALIVSAAGVLISTVLTLSLAFFMFYANSNKDSSNAALEGASKVRSLEKDVEFLKSENGDLKKAVATVQEDYKVIEATLNQYRIELATKGKITTEATK
jgi:hypothetical protein